MELSIIEVNGVSLALRSWGHPTDRPTILLLHAGGEDSLSWKSQAETWAETGRVYALDFRGHGESEHTDHYSLELMTADVVALLDCLMLDQVWIIGHSLGGMVGYLIASTQRPEVTRLVLEEAPPPLPIVPARPIPADPGEDFGFDWQVITDLYAQRNTPDPDWWQHLDRIEIPVLILAGGSSSHVDQDEMRMMATRIPTADLVNIDVGHNIHAAEPAKFLAAAEGFLFSGESTRGRHSSDHLD